MKNHILIRNLAIFSILMIVLFNYPILGIFNQVKWIGNVPTAFFYLFGVWLVSVILLIILIRYWQR